MPNWCCNVVTLRHKDPAMIERAAKAFDRGELLNEFHPMPKELREGDGWYGWAVNNWGTKWDVGGDGRDEITDPNQIELSFDSAWSPPIEAYRAMEEQGFEIEAHYYEPGVAFFGSYFDGCEDTIDFSSMDAETIRKEFPEHDERWGISDWLEDSQENLEIDLDGGLSAINEQDKE